MRIAIPITGVMLSVMLLTAAAAALVFELADPPVRLALFAAGGASWIVGIGWGVLANDRPPAQAS